MSEQLPISGLEPGQDLRPLTPRQQAAYDYIASIPGGVAADEIGAHLHHLRGKHAAGGRCDYCRAEGLSVTRSKALKPLLVRRRHGLVELRNPPTPPEPSGAQIHELPGDTWEDLFQRPDAGFEPPREAA